MPDPYPDLPQSEAEESLRRIAEALRNRDAADRAYLRAKDATKEAKKALDLADIAYRAICRHETTDLPLFYSPGVPVARPAVATSGFLSSEP